MKEKREKKKKRYAIFIARVLAIPLGALLGYWLCQIAMSIFTASLEGISANLRLIIYICCSVLFAVLFFISAPAFLEFIINMGFAIEKKLAAFSSRSMAAGMIGLVIGLITASLISNLINLIPYPPVAMILTVLTYVLLGTLGIVLGARKLRAIVLVGDKTEPTFKVSKVLDTSVLIDGRIIQLSSSGFLEGQLVVPKFVIAELHALSDSEDSQKRQKGRRGLDILAQLQSCKKNINLVISDQDFENEKDTDSKLVRQALNMKAKLVTLDFNLIKVATLMDVDVLNINELAGALKPTILVGDDLIIEILKHGKDKAQGVGYLPDGTMVVVENGGNSLGKTLPVVVTSNIQTSAGRMIFTRIPSLSE